MRWFNDTELVVVLLLLGILVNVVVIMLKLP